MDKTLRQWPLFGLFLSVLLFTAGCGGPSEEVASGPITAAELAGRIGAADGPVIFDVRTAEEYASGHVPGAINLPHSDVTERVGEFSNFQDREVIVYCRSGKRAEMAEADLRAAGFSNVRDLEGHMMQWEADGHPIE